MPRENKKRGRRADAQKRKQDGHETVTPSKRRRRTFHDDSDDLVEVALSANDIDYADGGVDAANDQNAGQGKQFYGLLDDEEQEYFRKADGMLQVNPFADAEERHLFVENVHKEAAGKELKLACSQSCSRLLERLIFLSTPIQLKSIFHQFRAQFLNLVQHRFASHCCETLFIQAARVVTQELLTGPRNLADEDSHDDKAAYSMEDYFLGAIQEFEGNIGYLMTNKFASHTIRVLLLVLSGDEMDASSHRSLLQGRKREDADVSRADKAKEFGLESRPTPDSFKAALQKMIADSLLGLETSSLRALATHHVGNPMLQLLIRLEVTRGGKHRALEEDSVIRKLLPDDPLTEGTESASFINGLLYDPIGSRLLESILEHAHGKTFKAIYKELFKHRLDSLARNEVASYVLCRVFDRLCAEEIEAATRSIIPEFPDLAQRGRTGVIKAVIDRCFVRNVDTEPLATALINAYAPDSPDPSSFLVNLLQLPPNLPASAAASTATSSAISPPRAPPVEPPTRSTNQTTALSTQTTPQILRRQHHATTLAQSMLQTSGPLSTLLYASLSALSPQHILCVARTAPLSPLLQTALTSPTSNLILRRKFITRLFGHFAALSQHPAASHVVDAVEQGTRAGLAFVRERVAEELAESEAQLRESACGRKVWRNWKMDLYKRRRGVWVSETRREVGNDGFQSFPGGGVEDDEADWGGRPSSSSTGKGRHGWEEEPRGRSLTRRKHGDSRAEPASAAGKTPLQLARERHAQKQRAKSAQQRKENAAG